MAKSSFNKELAAFLSCAESDKIIDSATGVKLNDYAQNKVENHHKSKGMLNLSSAIGGLGAFALLLGIVLVISSHWHEIPDIVKITIALFLMGGSHFAGLKFAKKGYKASASSCHFLGAGLFLANIGLIAQMFNLQSTHGTSYLLWTLMILPLAILLRSTSIGILALTGFLLWGNTYLFAIEEGLSILFFTPSVALLGYALSLYYKEKEPRLSSPFKYLSAAVVILGSYGTGFIHLAGHSLYEKVYEFHPSILIPLAFIALTLALIFKIQKTASKTARYELGGLFCAVLTMVLLYVSVVTPLFSNLYFTRFAFGHDMKVYFWPLLISISSWVTFFTFSLYMTLQGALTHRNKLLNLGVFLIGIGIFTRFIDLVGSMLDSGFVFIICGLFLLCMGYGLESWRSQLIGSTTEEKEQENDK